jgi:hypothetical protein
MSDKTWNEIRNITNNIGRTVTAATSNDTWKPVYYSTSYVILHKTDTSISCILTAIKRELEHVK